MFVGEIFYIMQARNVNSQPQKGTRVVLYTCWKMYLLGGDTSRSILDIFSIVLYFQIQLFQNTL